jgi:hypothetical protein
MKYLIAVLFAGCMILGHGEANALPLFGPAVYKSTNVAAAATIVNLKSGRTVLHCVIVSSAAALTTFTVYDSSNTTTTGRNILLNITASASGPLPEYCMDIETTYGISYVAVGQINAMLTYLDNK